MRELTSPSGPHRRAGMTAPSELDEPASADSMAVPVKDSSTAMCSVQARNLALARIASIHRQLETVGNRVNHIQQLTYFRHDNCKFTGSLKL